MASVTMNIRDLMVGIVIQRLREMERQLEAGVAVDTYATAENIWDDLHGTLSADGPEATFTNDGEVEATEPDDDVDFIEPGGVPTGDPEFVEMTEDDAEHIRRG